MKRIKSFIAIGAFSLAVLALPAVASAAADASRRVSLLERRGAAPDHPVVLNLPETEYLKCLVLQAE